MSIEPTWKFTAGIFLVGACTGMAFPAVFIHPPTLPIVIAQFIALVAGWALLQRDWRTREREREATAEKLRKIQEQYRAGASRISNG
jgi:L-lactate permease